ncbi:MAG: hypothetical protein LBB43_07745 [Spirochaetaceae bacterium]|jgi:hypothetical protein|nr:hypothetical protein [Spirochaetaceae bacterium]
MDDMDMLDDSNAERKALSKQGFNTIVDIAGGLGLLLLNGPIGAVLGVAAAIFGILALKSKDPEDRKPGTLLVVSGFLAIAAKVSAIGAIKPFAGTLLTIGAIGLIVTGLINGIKFIKGLKKRSK